MSAIEALYIYDRYAPTPALLLEHTFRSRSSTSANTLLQSYLSYPSQPPPSLIYLPSTNPPTLLFSTTHNNLLLLSPSTTEIEPLLVLTFLHRILDVLEDYLGSPLLPSKLEGNYDIVLQLLTEMADDGIPFTTEPNALRDVVLPPSTLGKLFGSMTGLPSNSLPAALAPGSQPPAQLSAIPWRRANVKHTANELYVDVIELLTCTLAPSGRPLAARVAGTIAFTAKISGVPDLLLNLTSPWGKATRLGLPPVDVVKNPSFHPCVRLSRWRERPGELSFVPPDGKFVLASYEVDLLDGETQKALVLPVTVDLTTALGAAEDEFEVRVFTSTSSLPHTQSSASSAASSSFSSRRASPAPSPSMSGTTSHPTVEDVTITIPLPPRVKSLSATRCSRGEFSFEGNEITWRIPSTGSSSGVASTATLRTGVVVREDEDGFSDPDDDEEDEPAIEEYNDNEDDEARQMQRERKRAAKEKEREKERERRRRGAKIMPRSVMVGFAVKGWLASGVRVESLKIVGGKGVGEGVKPYKGVKYVTKGSAVEVRC